MDITFRCDGCGRMLKAPSTSAGKKGRCNACGKVFAIPGGQPAAPPPAPVRKTEPDWEEDDSPYEIEQPAPPPESAVTAAPRAGPPVGTCKACGHGLAAGELFCTACGMNQATGKKLKTKVQKVPPPGGDAGGIFAAEKKGVAKGVLGGIVMIVIAVVWFLAGLAAGYIFFYPPILFLIGVYAVIKGLVTGNIAGD